MEQNSAAEVRTCQVCKNSFSIEPDDLAFYERMKVPPPTFCPECRMVRRMNWRNERNFYKRQCAMCEKSILAMQAPEKPFTVYCRECWYSDKWDAMTYGRDYDFSKPFFAQFRELLEAVPEARPPATPSDPASRSGTSANGSARDGGSARILPAANTRPKRGPAADMRAKRARRSQTQRKSPSE